MVRDFHRGMGNHDPQRRIAGAFDELADLLRRAVGEDPDPRSVRRPADVQEEDFRPGRTGLDALQQPGKRVATGPPVPAVKVVAQQFDLQAGGFLAGRCGLARRRDRLGADPHQQDITAGDLLPIQFFECRVECRGRRETACRCGTRGLAVRQQFELRQVNAGQIIGCRRDMGNARLGIRGGAEQKVSPGMEEWARAAATAAARPSRQRDPTAESGA